MRKEILPGTVISLKNDTFSAKYRILSTIGDGANCIVYEAEYFENNTSRLCRLKECYPFDADISRSDTKLIWNKNSEWKEYSGLFRNNHDMIAQLKNDELIGNNITNHVLLEGNGTLYSFMEINYADVYSRSKETDLHTIFETIRVLSEIVGSLHKKGYLHLDIKPENFLVSHHPNTYIWLFDVDSIVSVESIKKNKLRALSYSRKWAPPELIMGDVRKISQASDIFSIGAVLFEKVMGHPVESDDIGLFAKWDFSDNELFNDVNPAVIRKLSNLFKKTISANVNRRYQETTALCQMLKELCNLTVEGKPFIYGNASFYTTSFVGRENELRTISDVFSKSGHVIFLHGEAGIGKSTLAAAYAKRNAEKYDAVVQLRYSGSLKETLAETPIYNCDSDDTDERLRLISKMLVKSEVLFVIDNFDAETDGDDYLEELLGMKADFLFTSRTDFRDYYSGLIQLEVGELELNDAVSLFINASGINIEIEKDLPELETLFSIFGYNTYLIELLGLQCKASDYSLSKISSLVKKGIDSLKDEAKVRAHKDGKVSKNTVPVLIRILYNIAGLTDNQKQVLRNMYVMRFLRIDKETYRRYACMHHSEIDDINDLTAIGLVRNTFNYYHLHPIIEELIKNDLKPCQNNCEKIYLNLTFKINECIHSENYSELEQYQYEQNSNFVVSLLSAMDMSDSDNRELVLHWLIGINQNDNLSIESPLSNNYKSLYEKLEFSIATMTDFSEVFEIKLILLSAWLITFTYLFKDDSQNIKCFLKRNKYYDDIIEYINNMPENSQYEAYSKLCSVMIYYITQYPCFEKERFIIEKEKIISLYVNHNSQFIFDSDYDKSLFENKLYNIVEAEKPVVNTFEYDEDAKISESYFFEFHKSCNKKSFIMNLMENPKIDLYLKAAITDECLDSLFNPYVDIAMRRSGLDNPAEIIDIIVLQEELLLDDEFDVGKFEEYSYHLNRLSLYYAILYAQLGNREKFDYYAEELFDFEKEIRYIFESKIRFLHKYTLQDIYALYNALYSLDKASFIVSHLLKFKDMFEGYCRKYDREEDLFPVYKLIYECASEAYLENDISEAEKDYLWKLSEEYEKLMNQMACIDFETGIIE